MITLLIECALFYKGIEQFVHNYTKEKRYAIFR